jgi:hypothetical protein
MSVAAASTQNTRSPLRSPVAGDAAAVPVIWPESRIELANDIWGDINLSPETSCICPDYISALGIDPSMNVVEIGAGLGALSGIIRMQSSAYVIGFEIDPALVDRAVKLA